MKFLILDCQAGAVIQNQLDQIGIALPACPMQCGTGHQYHCTESVAVAVMLESTVLVAVIVTV